jgi:hypothetical protein
MNIDIYLYLMIISYFYLIENIKRRRHDNIEAERKKTINIIQSINVHKQKNDDQIPMMINCSI